MLPEIAPRRIPTAFRTPAYGLTKYTDFDGFRHWYHREGKDGADLGSAEEAEAMYQEWVDLGRPNVKK
jgi:hypothetical protein